MFAIICRHCGGFSCLCPLTHNHLFLQRIRMHCTCFSFCWFRSGLQMLLITLLLQLCFIWPRMTTLIWKHWQIAINWQFWQYNTNTNECACCFVTHVMLLEITECKPISVGIWTPFSNDMIFTGSLYTFTFYIHAPLLHLFYLQDPLFDLPVIYRLSIFPCTSYLHAPFFRFPCYLQAPFFNSHDIYKLPSLINMLFTASLFGLTFLFHMLFTYFWQPPSVLNLHVISRLNHKKFTGY